MPGEEGALDQLTQAVRQAVSKMLAAALELRGQQLGHKVVGQDLAKRAAPCTPQALSAAVNGGRPLDLITARRCLKELLKPDVNDVEAEHVHQRIEKFFFASRGGGGAYVPPPGVRDSGGIQGHRLNWFFDPHFAHEAMPISIRECTAEIRALKLGLKRGMLTSARIVFSSSNSRFATMDGVAGAGISAGGDLLLQCVRDGASVTFLYPRGEGSSEAAHSAYEFRSRCVEVLGDAEAIRRVRLVEVGPASSGMTPFFLPQVEFVLCESEGGADSSGTFFTALHGIRVLTGFSHDQQMIQQFRRWVAGACSPLLDDVMKPPVMVQGPA